MTVSIRSCFCWLASACLVLALPAAAIGQDNVMASKVTPAANASAPHSVQAMPADARLDDYRVGPHDLLELAVFQVDELSRTVRVNSRGQISLPLIGVIDAGGLTVSELETLLAKKLGETYLQNPQVTVFIKEFVSQRVIVEGSVKKAGVYPLTGRTTLLQVIAMASGLEQLANENEVKIHRPAEDGSREILVYDLEAIRAGKTRDPLIRGNDMVIVEDSTGRAVVKGVLDTLRGFVGFGPIRP